MHSKCRPFHTLTPALIYSCYPTVPMCVCVGGGQRRENLASSYRWWHLNRPKEERGAFECHMKGQGGMGYLGIPSFLWRQPCIQMGSYVRNPLFLALSLSQAFVWPLCLSEARRAVLLWFDALTLPCHWGVRSLVGQEWWHQRWCECVWVGGCVCVHMHVCACLEWDLFIICQCHPLIN